MRPPAWLAGLAVAVATLFVVAQTPVMALGVVSLLLVPALAIWAGVGVTTLLDPRRTITATSTALIVGVVIALFTAHVIMLQSRPAPPGTTFGGQNTLPRSRRFRFTLATGSGGRGGAGIRMADTSLVRRDRRCSDGDVWPIEGSGPFPLLRPSA